MLYRSGMTAWSLTTWSYYPTAPLRSILLLNPQYPFSQLRAQGTDLPVRKN